MTYVPHGYELFPVYGDAVPNVAKPVLYPSEEEEWQRTNLPKVIDAGIITQCVSP